MLKNFLLTGFCLITACSLSLFSADPAVRSVNVTVYNSDLGVIRENRSIETKQGISEIRIADVAERIDPTSVHIRLDGSVLEQNYQYDLVSLNKILEKYIDKQIQLTGKEGKFFEGTLLSVNNNQIVLRQKDGGLLMLPKLDEYQLLVGSLPEGLITKPTLVWTIDTKKTGRQDAELSYMTSGMNWHAEYVAVLNNDDTKMDLNSWVSIVNSSGATYKDATLKLVAGDVNFVSDAGAMDEMNKSMRYTLAESAPSQQFREKEFFEYHIYNLQRQTTIANNETKQISLFEASDVKVTKKFLLKSNNYASGKMKVAVVVEFENKEKNKLGIPMPKGKVRMYKSDGESVEFIGEDMIDHTPKDEKLKLKVGDAFDIVAEQKEEEQKKIYDRVAEHRYLITLKNRKSEDVEIEVERQLGYNWEILESSHKYDKKDAQTLLFKVNVKKGEEEEVRFRVRYAY